MSSLIYYLRHAQSKLEPIKDTAEWSLSDLGYQQAERVAAILSQTSFKKIYSSPYLRCRETIAPYCRVNNLDYYCLDRLKERQLLPVYSRKNYQEVHRKSWIYFDFALPGCESSKSAQSRITSTLEDIAQQHLGSRILVSGHGQLLALLMRHIDSNFGFKDQRNILNPELRVFKIGNGCIEESNEADKLQKEIRKIAVVAMNF